MPYSINQKRLYTLAATVSWFLLVSNSLLVNPSSYPAVSAANSALLGKIFKVSFITFVFLTQRVSVENYRGTDFIGYLWKLFIRAGSTAYVCAILFFGYLHYEKSFPGDHPTLLGTIYYINFAFLIYFLGKAFYIWRNMILFQKTRALQYEWKWFEIVIYATLLSNFIHLEFTQLVPLFGLFLLYTFFLSIHLRWVAYLTATKKWRSIFLLIGIILSLSIFYHFFNNINPPQQVANKLIIDPFVLATCIFVGMYTLASLLVAIFNLPTSVVFEQKREDLLNFQRLSQSIQQGEDETQVFKLMFESAIKASTAEAAWLELQDEAGRISGFSTEYMEPEEMERIR